MIRRKVVRIRIKMKKPLLLISLTCALPLFAAQKIEPKKTPKAPPTECCELVYPSCRFDVTCGWDVYFTAEGLWWIAKENGLVYAQSGSSGPNVTTEAVPPDPSSFNFKGNLQRVEPSWDWGFRIGLGYNFCYDEWDAKATWTDYRTSEKKTSTGVLLNLWGHSDVASSNNASTIKADWDLKYDTFDLELGRGFGAGRCFCLRPFLGIRAAWTDQTFQTFADVILPEDTQSQGPLSLDLKATSDFSGAGFRFGLDGRFDFCWDVSLFGLASYSLLYGSFDTDFKESTTGLTVQDLVIASSEDSFHMGLSSLQLALGLQWNRSYCCDRYRFGVHLAWEQNMWFQLNQMNHFQGALSTGNVYQENGNLSLQGISFGARFDF